MPDFGDMADDAKKLAGEHPDQAQEGMDKAADFADQKTGGRFDTQVKEGEQRAEDYLGAGGNDRPAGQGQGQDQPGQDQDQSGGQNQ